MWGVDNWHNIKAAHRGVIYGISNAKIASRIKNDNACLLVLAES